MYCVSCGLYPFGMIAIHT